MFEKINSLLATTLKDPVEVYDTWVPIIATIFAVLWFPISFILMLLFESNILNAQLSLPYRLLFFFVVLIIGLCIDYFIMLAKLAKARTYLNVERLINAVHIEAAVPFTPLSPEETDELLNNLINKNKGDNNQWHIQNL